jgi:hypothetical protein
MTKGTSVPQSRFRIWLPPPELVPPGSTTVGPPPLPALPPAVVPPAPGGFPLLGESSALQPEVASHEALTKSAKAA